MKIEKRKPDFKEVWIWHNDKPTQVNIWQVTHNNGQYYTNYLKDLNGKYLKNTSYESDEKPGYSTKEEILQEIYKQLRNQKHKYLKEIEEIEKQIKEIQC